jgi:hypothetical protein
VESLQAYLIYSEEVGGNRDRFYPLLSEVITFAKYLRKTFIANCYIFNTNNETSSCNLLPLSL